MAFATTCRPNRLIIILQMVLFLVVHFINESTTAKLTAHFITKPKRKEIFVGDSVQFAWDYKDDNDEVKYVIFGTSTDAVGTELTPILRKKPGEDVVIYLKAAEKDSGIRAEEGKRASFRVKDVSMNRSGYYYCELQAKDVFKGSVKDIVHMQVVDLQIDTKQSDDVVESWKNQVVSLACSVRVTDNTPVEFTWQQKPSNRTLSRGKHVDANKESILKLMTSNNEHFTTYTCIAKTKKTVREHNIVVKRLYGPGAPENLQAQLTFNKARAESYYKLTWTKPTNDGGAKVTGYIVEYKPERISWDKATRGRTEKLEFTKLNIKEGKTYNIRVRARNKVTEGEHSNEIKITLKRPPTNKGQSTNNSNKVQVMSWLNLLSISLLLFYMAQASFEHWL